MGEIMIRGYCVMLGYWADQDKTNECITESGWYKTGWVEAELQTQHIRTEKHQEVYSREKDLYKHRKLFKRCSLCFPAETSAAWTRTATARSTAGLKTWSSGEERTFTRPRSNSSSTHTPKSRRPRWAQTVSDKRAYCHHVLYLYKFISVEKTRTISLAAEQHVVVFLSVRWSEFRMPVWVKRSAPASSWWTDRRALQRKSKITARARWGTAHFKWSIVSWNHSLLWSSLLTVFFCSFQISHFKIPRYVLFVTSYPLTITGKVISQIQSSHIPIKRINDRQIRFILLCLWSRHASRLKQMYN